ncbi:MAG: hypothetical protein JXB38_07330 [Anaerolineales bacterium]|nr:hypothetical protein [Anaerolineales bacterium]
MLQLLVMNTTQPPRNPHTHRRHRRETFWQITLPLILGALVMLGLAVWAVLTATGGSSVEHAAGAALIFLLIPAMFMALFVLAILGGLAYLVILVNGKLPPYLRQAQDFFARARDFVGMTADKLVEPVLRAQSGIAALKAIQRETSFKNFKTKDS